MRFIQRVAVAALTAGIAATTAVNGAEQPLPDEQAATAAASGAVPASPAEEAATAILNKKIADDNAALEASEKAKQEAYERQVQQQQEAYEQQVKQQQAQYEQQKADVTSLERLSRATQGHRSPLDVSASEAVHYSLPRWPRRDDLCKI